MLLRIVFAISVFLWSEASAQMPVASYTLPATACANQRIEPTNSSVNADRFEWDFCLDDLRTLKSSGNVLPITGLNGGYGYKLVEDNGLWFGFATSENNSKLYRLEFGNSPMNFPTVFDLGNLGGILDLPEGIDIVQLNGLWFGFVGSLDFSAPTQGILRLDFGSSLTNTPVVQNLGNFGFTTRFRDLKIIQQGTDYILVLVNYNANGLVLVNFHNSFSNVPGVSDILDTGPISGVGLPVGIDFARRGSAWIALLASLNTDQIIQLNFGTNIFSVPAVETGVTFPGLVRPYKVKLIREGDNYFAAVSNETNQIQVIDFKDLNPIHPSALVPHSGLPVLLAFDGIRYQGTSVLMGTNTFDNQLSRLQFQANCGASIDYSNAQVPQGLAYSSSGIKLTELKVYLTSSGASDSQSRSIVISSNTSPDISFTSDGKVCAGNAVNFSSINSSGDIVSYQWNFGDLSPMGTSAAASHIFSPGNFDIRLNVTASNGCVNFASNPITIYSQPVPNFSLPTPSIACTNQVYTFVNTSTFDPTSNPGWQWRVNGTLTSSTKDLAQSFNSSVNQSVQLTASIPGCTSQSTQNFLVQQPGPLVDFAVGTGCIGKPLPFTNLTSGVGITYTWSFGDGNTSTQTNPSNSYLAGGPFSTTLTTLSPNGCQNANTKVVDIYTNPQPDFSVGLPPFSCSNSPTQFQNNTPALTDSNIIGWNWQFGDSGTSSLAVPIHTYTLAGPYTAILTATSDKGCSTQFTRIVNISASPTADFTLGPSCLNLSTKFMDISSGGVTSLLWQIASSTFTIPNPSYTFTSSGNYFATLTATSANGCISVKTKTVNVPVSPTVNFTVTNLCSGKNTTFTDITNSPQDAVVGWNWNFAGNSVAGNPATYIFTPDGTYNVKLTTTHTSGCKYTLSKNILINPSPVAAFTASPDRGSSPLIVQFTNTSQQANQYAWKFYDKVIATSSSASPIYTFVSLGDYSAELTASNTFGCADILTVPIKVLVPSIDLIMKDFQLATDPLTGKIKSVVTIMNNSNIPITAAEVALFLADKAVVNETLLLNLAPGQTTTRTLSFALSSNQFDFTFLCAEVLSDKDIQNDNNKRCINLEETDYIFSPYPNPTSGTIKVDWISRYAGTAKITVYDNMGRKAYEWETAMQAGLNQGVLDLSFLTAGMFYLTVETAETKKTSRFFRE